MRLEDVEAKLRKKLEEIERRKQRLKELEEEERKILEELGFSKGTVVAKWVKCGKGCRKCPHGPYYYLVYKEGGKTRWKYLGKSEDSKLQTKHRALKERLKEIQREKRMLEKVDF